DPRCRDRRRSGHLRRPGQLVPAHRREPRARPPVLRPSGPGRAARLSSWGHYTRAMQRRTFLGLAGAAVISSRPRVLDAQSTPAKKGVFKQGVTRGVFARGTALEDCCRQAADLGIKGFDLIGPADWPTLKKFSLVPSMYPGPAGTIASALNRVENHAKLGASLNAGSDEAAANGVPNIITFSGNRNGMDDREGADNCVTFLNA